MPVLIRMNVTVPSDRPGAPAAVRGWIVHHWRLLVLGSLFVVLYLPQLVFLAGVIWQEQKYSHGPLIPLVSLFFLWMQREEIAALPARPALSGLFLLVPGILFWFQAQAATFNALAHTSMLFTLAGMVVFTMGWKYLKAVAFPLLFLGFAFPVPERLDELYVVPFLQQFAAVCSDWVLNAVGIVAIRDGAVIEIPGRRLFVEEGCSGIHSLYSLMAVGTAYAFLTEWRSWQRVLLVLSTLPVAILANIMRVSGTGILAYSWDPDFAKGLSHSFWGMAVFVMGLFLFLGFAGLLHLLAPGTEKPGEED